MKKRLSLLLVLVLIVSVFSGCCLKHEWEDATCDDPMTCSKCGEIKGDPLDHEWVDASCASPKHCELCGKTRGEALAHTWQDATCSSPKRCTVCSATEGTALAHTMDDWSINSDTMTGTCTVCGKTETKAVDWSVAGPELILGRWEMTTVFIGDDQYNNSGYIEFFEDGTANMNLNGKNYRATWSYDFKDDEDPACVFYEVIQDGDHYTGIIFDDDINGLGLVFEDLTILYAR